MQNPADALAEISKQLKQKFDEAGMDKVEQFTDTMEDLLAKLKEGPDKAMGAAQDKFKEFTGKIEGAIKDPASLAPPGGGLAACGAWYGTSVAGKLILVKDEVDALVASLSKLAGDVKAPILKLIEGLQGAIADLETAVKGLAKLPKLVQEELAGKTKPEDIAKIDTEKFKKALATGDLDGPLKVIGGMKDVLKQVIAILAGGAQSLADFISAAPGMVRGAFDVPTPLCFLTSMLMDAGPQALKDLLALCEKLEKVSLAPIMQTFSGASATVEGINVDAIKVPVNKFKDSAKELVDKLEKTVHAAKMAGGGGGALASIKKLF